jgi:ATP-dependent exoDNAse (exonuclease V) alpha subunit
MEQEKKVLREIRNEWHNYWFLRKMLMPDLEYTYAMTIHKAQGSQWPLVYVDIPRLYTFKDGRRLIYTAVSRAQEKVTFTF